MDGTRDPATVIEDNEAERRAKVAAVAEARANSRPAMPYEQVHAKLLRFADEMWRKIASLPDR